MPRVIGFRQISFFDWQEKDFAVWPVYQMKSINFVRNIYSGEDSLELVVTFDKVFFLSNTHALWTISYHKQFHKSVIKCHGVTQGWPNHYPGAKKCPPRHFQVPFKLFGKLNLLNSIESSATLDRKVHDNRSCNCIWCGFWIKYSA